MLADIIDQKRPYRAPIIRRCDGPIAFLAGGIPDLGLDGFRIDLNAAGCEFDTDGGFGIQVEFVSGKS